MVDSKEFTEEEVKEILRKGIMLLKHNYFSGMNFTQSDTPFPDESLLIHFLHDSKLHLEAIVKRVELPHMISPRQTFYRVDPKYLQKKNFVEEYKNARFYDEDLNELSISEILEKPPKRMIVENSELDLIIPYNANNLNDIILSVQEADKEGPIPFADPVIIIRTRHLIETVPGFKNEMEYVSIARETEEFYTLIHDEKRVKALKKYLGKICNQGHQIGTLSELSIAFHLSQINEEFFDYITKNLGPLKPLE